MGIVVYVVFLSVEFEAKPLIFFPNLYVQEDRLAIRIVCLCKRNDVVVNQALILVSCKATLNLQ